MKRQVAKVYSTGRAATEAFRQAARRSGGDVNRSQRRIETQTSVIHYVDANNPSAIRGRFFDRIVLEEFINFDFLSNISACMM